MAIGETFKGSPDKPESEDSGKRNKKSNKRTTPVRAPLGLAAEMPAPKLETTQAPTRLFNLIAEHEHLHEQMKRRKADGESTGSDKKKPGNNQEKTPPEQTETTESSKTVSPEAVKTTKTPEGSESVDTDTETPKDDTEKPISEGAAEIALDDSLEEIIPLSDRAKEHIKEWNRARPQSPPRVPMSEVGQPTVAPETEIIEVPAAEMVEQAETSTAAAAMSMSEAEPMIAPEVAPDVTQKESAPVPVPPIFEWQTRSQPQASAESHPFSSSMPETAPAPMESVDTNIEQPLPVSAGSGDAPIPPHNPLFTQQGIDPTFAHNKAVEASAPQTTVERVVHHRPSDFWPGVFVGGAVEHIRHKRRERKMEKSQKLQQSRIAQLEYTQRRTALEQQSSANEQLRAEDAARYEKPVAATEVFPMAFATERGPEQPKTEQQPTPKQPSPEQPIAAEEVKPLEGHHIEKSTWHKIEVDDRTGHVAENSNIVYGEAFQRELRPEQIAAQQAQQQAEAKEQEQEERAAQATIGVPTLPRPQAGTADASTPSKPTTRPTVAPAPVQRNKVLRPAFVQSGADMALWGGLVLVVLAIIAALTL